jgi:hypothetical protein
VLADRERLLGAEHPDTLRARANVASSYSSAGRTSDAIELRELALAERAVVGLRALRHALARANLATEFC